MRSKRDVTALLLAYQGGEKKAFDELFALVYGELKKMANSQLSRHRRSPILTPTALVHEAFMKLKEHESWTAQNRAHFYSIAGKSMRWLIIDHAKNRLAGKRGGGAITVPFNDEIHSPHAMNVDLMSLGTALEKLAELDPRLSRVVELKYLVGLSIEEIAESLGVSPSSVKRDWATARTWLLCELFPDDQRNVG